MHDRDALMAELEEIQARHKMQSGGEFLTREARDGSTIYAVKTANGYHESAESYDHALFLLVDSFRTRIEDTQEFRDRLALAGVSGGVRKALAIGSRVKLENPDMTGEERDALTTAILERHESDKAAAEAAAALPWPDAEC